jgi:tetratricopeptide (TPR) repeat protein
MRLVMAIPFFSERRKQGKALPVRLSERGFCFLVLSALLVNLPGMARAQQDAFKHAAELTQTGKLHEAEVAWRQLVQAHPTNAAVHSGLGVTLAQEGNLQQAAVEYRKALALNPRMPGISFNLGLAEFKQGHFAAAIKPLMAAAAEKPNDKRSGLLVGMSYFGLHQYAKAVPYLQTATISDPSNLELHNVLAQSCLWSAQYACAMDQYKAILNADPDSVQAHMLLGQALDSLDRSAEAIAELETAARIAPNEPNVHFELGYLYYTQHDYERASAQFELELKNNPANAQALTYLADIKIRNNDDSAAETLLTKAVHLQNDIRLAYFDLGIVYANQKRNQDAIKALLRAEELDPREPDAHYRLARIYMAVGEKQKADQEFAKTEDLHSKTAESLIQKVTGPTASSKQ